VISGVFELVMRPPERSFGAPCEKNQDAVAAAHSVQYFLYRAVWEADSVRDDLRPYTECQWAPTADRANRSTRIAYAGLTRIYHPRQSKVPKLLSRLGG
jgi:hypothetical protein